MSTQKYVRLMLPFVISGIVGAKRRTDGRLVEKLDEVSFVTKNILEVNNSTVISIQILDDEPLLNLLAGEANRFALASSITRQRSNQPQSRNASWQAIEHYYSAFYAIQYLLRATGTAVTNLDNQAVKQVISNLLGQSNNVDVPSGLYTLRYDNNAKIATLTKRKNKPAGGSHIEVWQLWAELVDKLSTQTNSDITEYANEAIELATHKKFLVKSQDRYNPPTLRAEINYQFRGGVWAFENTRSQSVLKIQASIASQNNSSLGHTLDTASLISNNKFIIGLAKAIFEHSANSYPKAISKLMKHTYSEFLV